MDFFASYQRWTRAIGKKKNIGLKIKSDIGKKKKKVSEKWSMAWRPLHSIEESNVNIESAMRRLVPGTGLSGSVKRDGG